jgi:hypothetical protein
MNRRLFVRQLTTGLSLPLVAAVPSMGFGAASANPLWCRSTAHLLASQLGTLQSITISHVYSPERTSIATLKALTATELTAMNTLLGTAFSLTAQTWAQLAATTHGSHGTQLEQDGVTLSWQALARIGNETARPSTRLIVSGSKGILQVSPIGNGYQLIDRQGEAVALGGQLSEAVDQLPRPHFRQA